jgi:amino acid adenylation domain-containing protein/non-ribosomal peptide synthase protein (TIGR01720 family)
VLRSQVRPHEPFSALLTRVRETVLEAHAHQDVPFELILEELAEELAPTREFAPHTPFHRATFVMHNTPKAEAADLSGLRLTDFDGSHDTSKRELALGIVETSNGLYGSFAYATDLFSHDTIERMARHFERLLRAIILDPEQPIGRLALLNDAERQQLCVAWNDTARPAPRAGCIHELFTDHAERQPDAIALTFEEQHLTYGELHRRARQLARYLGRAGVGVETRVAICLDRGFDIVIAVLAALEAGAAYVALDPAYPPERLSQLVTQSQAPVLITRPEIQDRLMLLPWVQTMVLDAVWPAIAQETADACASGVCADNIAYIEYTSGSTGGPKGVAVPHAGAANLAHGFIDAFAITPGTPVLQFFSWSFDGAVAEWMMTLLAGARLVLARRETLASGAGLIRLIDEEQIEVSILPPSLLGVLEGEAPTLRTLISAGEACTEAIAARWAPGRNLVNAYGPTECSVCVTIADPATGTEVPPIGRPMGNVRVYVLDDESELAPIGVAGDLYVGGAGVARGYLDAPGLTAERFVPDPFGSTPGARLYRTGDLVRWRADGNLMFLGRKDQQIKIRGFRVEPAEIERVLNQHPQVQHVVADVREDQTRRPRLIAYVVPHGAAAAANPGEEQPLVKALQQLAKQHLPDYMVPSAIVLLERLPLTPTGKIDRRALPAPDQQTARNRTEPRTAAERVLADIWRQVLRVERVGADDNFFDLGGDSILSIQVVARAIDAGLQLAPRDVFTHPTLAALAEVASPAGAGTDGDTDDDDAGAATRPVPLTPIQHWLFEQPLAAPHRYIQALTLQGRERVAPHRLARAIRALVDHHDALRMRFVAPTPQQPSWQQRQAPDEPANVFLSIDLAALDADTARAAMRKVNTRLGDSLDLTHGPLLRIAHFNFGPDQQERLSLVAHHLVVDGVSWRILLRDLETVYAQLRRGEPVNLPRKTTSFRRWAEALNRAAASEQWAAERDYWLTPSEPVTALPRDADGPNTVGSARTVGIELDEARSLALIRELRRITGAHADEILLTALADAVARWTGSPALAIDLEGHGREDLGDGLDLTQTIGWFTATYPVTLPRLSGEGLLQQLDDVKARVRAIPHRGIGYGLLRYLSPDDGVRQALRARPAAEIGFNYLGQFDQLFEADRAWVPITDEARRVHDDPSPRVHLIEMVASVRQNRLYASFSYSHHVHREETIARLAETFLRTLEQLIDESVAAPAAPAPADFPLAGLTGDQLAAVLQQLDASKRSDTSTL